MNTINLEASVTGHVKMTIYNSQGQVKSRTEKSNRLLGPFAQALYRLLNEGYNLGTFRGPFALYVATDQNQHVMLHGDNLKTVADDTGDLTFEIETNNAVNTNPGITAAGNVNEIRLMGGGATAYSAANTIGISDTLPAEPGIDGNDQIDITYTITMSMPFNNLTNTATVAATTMYNRVRKAFIGTTNTVLQQTNSTLCRLNLLFLYGGTSDPPKPTDSTNTDIATLFLNGSSSISSSNSMFGVAVADSFQEDFNEYYKYRSDLAANGSPPIQRMLFPVGSGNVGGTSDFKPRFHALCHVESHNPPSGFTRANETGYVDRLDSSGAMQSSYDVIAVRQAMDPTKWDTGLRNHLGFRRNLVVTVN